MNMSCDPCQRMLLACVLGDALEIRLAPLLNCPACEHWMESGPCPQHREGHETTARYLRLSARLEASPAPAWLLRHNQAQIIAQALPEALSRRLGSVAAVDAALIAAYTALAPQLSPVNSR